MKTRNVKLRLTNEEMEWLTWFKKSENFKNYSGAVNFLVSQCYESIMDVVNEEYEQSLLGAKHES